MTYNKVSFRMEDSDSMKMLDISPSSLTMLHKAGFSDFIIIEFCNRKVIEGNIFHYPRQSQIRVRISEIEDEWFLLRIDVPFELRYTYYRCDQIEGVIDCLKDISNTYKRNDI